MNIKIRRIVKDKNKKQRIGTLILINNIIII